MSFDNLFWGDIDTPNHSQWRIKAESLLADRDIFHATAIKYFPLGAIAETRDGRRFRYCEKDGTNSLTKTYLISGQDGNSNYYDQLQTYGTASVIGDKSVSVNLDTTAAAHLFIDGYMVVNQGTGYREMYTIKDNDVTVADADENYDCTIYIADQGGIRTAHATTANITIVQNKFKDVIVAAVDSVSVVIGVPLCTVAVNQFFWAQTRGPCPVAVDDTDTIVAGDYVMLSTSVAGTVALVDSSADDQLIGQCMEIAPVNETALIDLTIE